jgi:hypothetical protein
MTDENPVPPKQVTPWFSDKTYNVLKFIAQILLPALGTLYAAIAGLWGLPAVEEVVGTVLAVDTFLGVLLGISSAQHAAITPENDGVLVVQQHDAESGTLRLDMHSHPSELAGKDTVTFKVDASPMTVVEEDSTPGGLPPVPPGV